MPLRAVYTSPLARAMATAAAVAAPHGLPIVVHDGLREIGVGAWEGLLVDEIERRYPEVLRQWWDRPHLTRIPGGETLEELRERAATAFAAIARDVGRGTAAVVGHGGVNKTILLDLLGAPLSSYWRIRQANACINIVELSDPRVLVRVLNETSHLGALARPGEGSRAQAKRAGLETW